MLEDLSDPNVGGDPARLRDLSRRHKELQGLISAGRRLSGAEDDVHAARDMVAEADPADRDLARVELERAEADVRVLEEELRTLLLPRDPNDGRNVIVEIRGAEGGEEANLFARDLFEMYRRYAELRGWRLEVLSSDPSERDGLNEVTFVVKGDDAWQRLKHEGGTHRVQRVPVTESQGRIHTSAATVMVLPEAEEVEITIDPADLRVDVFRSTGPGGQSVNTTDSAVRITHIPSGRVVEIQDEKSQHKNKAKALAVLRARLQDDEKQKQLALNSSARRSMVGGGDRSDKIRTYNYPQDRVSDHRVNQNWSNLPGILDGDLDPMIDVLITTDQAERLQSVVEPDEA